MYRFYQWRTENKISSPRDLLFENGSFIKMKVLPWVMFWELACKALGISNLRVCLLFKTRSTLPAILDWILKLPWVIHWYKGVDWGAYPNSRNYLIGLNFCILMN